MPEQPWTLNLSGTLQSDMLQLVDYARTLFSTTMQNTCSIGGRQSSEVTTNAELFRVGKIAAVMLFLSVLVAGGIICCIYLTDKHKPKINPPLRFKLPPDVSKEASIALKVKDLPRRRTSPRSMMTLP